MIVKEDKVLMIKGSTEDVIFDLITICFAIHKKMGIPKEVISLQKISSILKAARMRTSTGRK